VNKSENEEEKIEKEKGERDYCGRGSGRSSGTGTRAGTAQLRGGGGTARVGEGAAGLREREWDSRRDSQVAPGLLNSEVVAGLREWEREQRDCGTAGVGVGVGAAGVGLAPGLLNSEVVVGLREWEREQRDCGSGSGSSGTGTRTGTARGEGGWVGALPKTIGVSEPG
jgi:hypothetical protein